MNDIYNSSAVLLLLLLMMMMMILQTIIYTHILDADDRDFIA